MGTSVVEPIRQVAVASRVRAASNRASTPMGVPAASARTALSGPVWCSGATTRWRPLPTKRFAPSASTKPAHESRIGNTFGGSSVAFGRPVVPDVKSRLGGIGRSSAGGPAGAPATQVSHSSVPHTWTAHEGTIAAAARAASAVPGPATTTATSPVSRRYAASLAFRWLLTATTDAPDRSPPRWAITDSAAFSANTATRRGVAPSNAASRN